MWFRKACLPAQPLVGRWSPLHSRSAHLSIDFPSRLFLHVWLLLYAFFWILNVFLFFLVFLPVPSLNPFFTRLNSRIRFKSVYLTIPFWSLLSRVYPFLSKDMLSSSCASERPFFFSHCQMHLSPPPPPPILCTRKSLTILYEVFRMTFAILSFLRQALSPHLFFLPIFRLFELILSLYSLASLLHAVVLPRLFSPSHFQSL